MAVGIVVFGVLAGVIYGFGLNSHVDGVKAIAMIMSSIYNMLVLTALLSYGLI